MIFSEFIKYKKFINETTMLIKNYNKNSQIIKIGKLGWWTVWSSAPNSGYIQDKKPINQKDYDYLKNSDIYAYDYMQEPEVISKLKQIFEDAAYELAALGFPRMHSNVVLADLSKEINRITGGGVGGLAHRLQHGIVISRSDVHISTVIHEHAHMFWFNLPKRNKEFFQKYYKINIKNNREIIEPYEKKLLKKKWTQESDKNFNLDELKQKIKNNFEDFYAGILRLEKTPKNYFEIKNAIEAGESNNLINLLLLNNHGDKCHCVLKDDITFSTYGGNRKNMKKGDIVYCAKYSNAYILEYFENSVMYEHPHTISLNEIDQYIEYDYGVLSDREKTKYNENLEKVKNINPVKLFAPFRLKEDVNKLFEEIGKNIANQFADRYNLSIKYKYEDLFDFRRLQYSNWVALISRRLKKGAIKNEKDFESVYIEMYEKNINKNFKENPPENYDLYNKQDIEIDKPEATSLRQSFANARIAPSEYAAANVDELWAVSVEYAALNKNLLSSKLKKLIYQTINGV